jgi:hypothetical protein
MKCKCSMAIKVLGEGCEACNPAQALEYAKDTIIGLNVEIDELKISSLRARRDQTLHLVELAQDLDLPSSVIQWLRAEAGKLIELPNS